VSNHDSSNRPPPLINKRTHPSIHPPTPPRDPARPIGRGSLFRARPARVPIDRRSRRTERAFGWNKKSPMRAFPRRNTSPVEWVARTTTRIHPFATPRNLIFFPTPRARIQFRFRPSHPRRRDSRARINKKETYRNSQTPLDRPLDRPRGRPPVCSSGAAARIRSPSAPPGRSRRWMTTPVPVPVPVPVPPALPVRSTGVNPRNHPPSWTCSVPFRSVPCASSFVRLFTAKLARRVLGRAPSRSARPHSLPDETRSFRFRCI